MVQITFDRPQSIKISQSAPNPEYWAIIFKVVDAVSWLKDRVIDFFPKQTATQLDSRRIFTRTALDHVASDQMIESVAGVRANERDVVTTLALDVITKDMDTYSRGKIIEALAAVPASEREEVGRNAMRLITSRMDRVNRVWMIKSVAGVRANERDVVTTLALDVITKDMDTYSRGKIIEALAAVPASEREEVGRNTMRLITSRMDRVNRVWMIKSVAGVRANERDVVTTLALDVITKDMDTYSRGKIIEALAAVPASEREEVGRNAMRLITSRMDRVNRVWMIKSVAGVRANERDVVTTLALDVITKDMDTYSRDKIIEALAAVPASEREEVGRNAMRLITSRMDRVNRVWMIKSVAGVRANERDVVTTLALDVITKDMDTYSRGKIIEAVATVPAADRVNVMEHALQLINPHMRGQDRAMIIRNLAAVPADQRANDVQQRRQGRHVPVVQNAQVAAQHGVNVHEGNRDQRAKAALELLQQRQGEMPIDRINQAVQEFTQYLNDRQMKAEHKQLAQRALSAPKDPNEAFGPLISDTNFSVLGLVLSGQELIGRLWVFASNLQDPDRTNAKDGMISALKDSYQMGFRVCDQGKTQRLVVAVLQGRLEGVDIELIPEMQIPTLQAVEMFFNVEAHRNIEQLVPLIDAANRLCDENPAVNRADFIREIREYAQTQGFGEESIFSSLSSFKIKSPFSLIRYCYRYFLERV